MSLPDSLAGFVLFPVVYSSKATHIIYGRAHSGSKKSDKAASNALPEGRTLFLVNVPPDATERELMLYFKPSGLVEKVVRNQHAAENEGVYYVSDSDEEVGDEEIQDGEGDGVIGLGETAPKKKGKGKGAVKEQVPVLKSLPVAELRTLRQTGGTAYVVFLDASSLERALSAPQHKPRPWPRSSEPVGLAHYAALHDALRPPLDAVRAHADSAMEVHDYNEAKTKQRSKYRKGEAVVDEDGFTVVVRGGAYGKTLGGEVGVASKKFMETGEASQRKKKKKEKMEIYSFQRHERKRKELIDLKKKWEEDKAKVEKLKASRRFKPY